MSSSAPRWVCGNYNLQTPPHPARVRRLELVKIPRRGPACTKHAPCYSQLMDGIRCFFVLGYSILRCFWHVPGADSPDGAE